jgi:hypothetical protein
MHIVPPNVRGLTDTGRDLNRSTQINSLVALGAKRHELMAEFNEGVQAEVIALFLAGTGTRSSSTFKHFANLLARTGRARHSSLVPRP